jgi:hypothetical protein
MTINEMTSTNLLQNFYTCICVCRYIMQMSRHLCRLLQAELTKFVFHEISFLKNDVFAFHKRCEPARSTTKREIRANYACKAVVSIMLIRVQQSDFQSNWERLLFEFLMCMKSGVTV